MTRAEEVDAQLEAIYQQIPDINCKGLCQDACGPITGGHRELIRLKRAGVTLLPVLAQVEALATGDYTCPALVNGQCSTYDVRPAICFLPDAYIYTATGPRQIGTVLAGDKVYGKDGKLHTVLGTASRWYEGQIANVRFSGTHIPCWSTTDHHWLCTSQKDKRKTPKPYWKPAGDLKAKRHHKLGDYLCFPRAYEDVPDLEHIEVKDFIAGQLSEDGQTLRPFTVGSFAQRRAQTMPAVIEVEDEFLYMLGIFLAEGSASIQTAAFTLHEKERHIAERISAYLKTLGISSSITVKPSRSTLQLSVPSALFGRLMKMLCGTLAGSKAIAEDLFGRLSHIQKWKVFEAWNEGDGRKCLREREISVTTISLKLALQMGFVALASGYFPRTYVTQRSNRGTTCYDVHLFPSNWRGPAANHGTRNMADEAYTYTPATDSELRSYAGPVIDIQVEGVESFVTSSGVAHNCRVWGAAEDLPCPFGCAPADGALLTAAEAHALIQSATNAGTPLASTIFTNRKDT